MSEMDQEMIDNPQVRRRTYLGQMTGGTSIAHNEGVKNQHVAEGMSPKSAMARLCLSISTRPKVEISRPAVPALKQRFEYCKPKDETEFQARAHAAESRKSFTKDPGGRRPDESGATTRRRATNAYREGSAIRRADQTR